MHQVIILAGSVSDQTNLGSMVVVDSVVDAEVEGLIVVVVVEEVPSVVVVLVVVVVDADEVDVGMAVVDIFSFFSAVVVVFPFCFSPSL